MSSAIVLAAFLLMQDQHHIDQLVQKLSAESDLDRESAAKELVKIGAAALPGASQSICPLSRAI